MLDAAVRNRMAGGAGGGRAYEFGEPFSLPAHVLFELSDHLLLTGDGRQRRRLEIACVSQVLGTHASEDRTPATHPTVNPGRMHFRTSVSVVVTCHGAGNGARDQPVPGPHTGFRGPRLPAPRTPPHHHRPHRHPHRLLQPACGQPRHPEEAAEPQKPQEPREARQPCEQRTPGAETPVTRPRNPLPAVSRPAYSGPGILQAATDLLASLRRHDPGLLLSACDTAHLAPGVAAWLERDVAPAAVRRALTADLPPEGVRRPAAFLAHRLTARLPPPPPFRASAAPTPVRHPVQNCDGCDRGFRAPEPGRCRDCRTDDLEDA